MILWRWYRRFSGERQKFLDLIQEESEPTAFWETRIRNQGAQIRLEGIGKERVVMGTEFFIALRVLHVELLACQVTMVSAGN